MSSNMGGGFSNVLAKSSSLTSIMNQQHTSSINSLFNNNPT